MTSFFPFRNEEQATKGSFGDGYPRVKNFGQLLESPENKHFGADVHDASEISTKSSASLLSERGAPKGGCFDQGLFQKFISWFSWLPWFSWFLESLEIFSIWTFLKGMFQKFIVWFLWFSWFRVWEMNNHLPKQPLSSIPLLRSRIGIVIEMAVIWIAVDILDRQRIGDLSYPHPKMISTHPLWTCCFRNVLPPCLWTLFGCVCYS